MQTSLTRAVRKFNVKKNKFQHKSHCKRLEFWTMFLNHRFQLQERKINTLQKCRVIQSDESPPRRSFDVPLLLWTWKEIRQESNKQINPFASITRLWFRTLRDMSQNSQRVRQLLSITFRRIKALIWETFISFTIAVAELFLIYQFNNTFRCQNCWTRLSITKFPYKAFINSTGRRLKGQLALFPVVSIGDSSSSSPREGKHH